MQIATARAKFLRDFSASSSQIAELQKRYDAQSKEIESIEKELSIQEGLVKEKNCIIAPLTAEVDHWKHEVATKAKQAAAELRDEEGIQEYLALFSSWIADIEQRYDAQAVHSELQTNMSLLDHAITFLTAALMQAQSEDGANADQIATARSNLRHLRCLLSMQIIIVLKCFRMLGLCSDSVSASSKQAITQSQSRKGYLPLDWEARMSLMYPTTFTDAASQLAELQRRYNAQSEQLDSVRNKLQITKSLVEEKDRTITTLTAEVRQWKCAADTEAARFAAVRNKNAELLKCIAAFFPHIADLQRRYDAQSKAIRDELQTRTSLLEHTITFINTAFTQAQSEDRAKAKQIATVCEELEQLRCVLFEKITNLQERCVAHSEELESVRTPLNEVLARYRTADRWTDRNV